jgi:hypothetical protein
MDVFPGWVGWVVAAILLVILIAVITSDWWRARGRGKEDRDDRP